jgi:hypothetical protein
VTQTVVLIVLNAMLRGWVLTRAHGQALGSAA